MNPRTFLKKYHKDERQVTGRYFNAEPLPVVRGDRVGVVLLSPGGPFRQEDIAPFLYNLYMDPALIDVPLKGWLRHRMAKRLAQLRARPLGAHYEAIGGASPLNRLTQEQARALETLLNERFGQTAGVEFRTYIAMRYWNPSSEEAARLLKHEGIDKVVLLPLYPQYSETTTGSSLRYWWMLEQAGEMPSRATTFAYEYAAHPKYIQALSERIDEALQRFPRAVRAKVHLVFSAHGTPLREMTRRRDPYCCLIHQTVSELMARRAHDHPFHVGFHRKLGLAHWLSAGASEQLKTVSKSGGQAVLMIPVTFVSDHLETAYMLDVRLREEAETLGIEHYEVTSGLNCHPLFIEALAEVTLSQLQVRDAPLPRADSTAPHPRLRPKHHADCMDGHTGRAQCDACPANIKARRWDPEAAPIRLDRFGRPAR